jgi:hypothetical protein
VLAVIWLIGFVLNSVYPLFDSSEQSFQVWWEVTVPTVTTSFVNWLVVFFFLWKWRAMAGFFKSAEMTANTTLYFLSNLLWCSISCLCSPIAKHLSCLSSPIAKRLLCLCSLIAKHLSCLCSLIAKHLPCLTKCLLCFIKCVKRRWRKAAEKAKGSV